MKRFILQFTVPLAFLMQLTLIPPSPVFCVHRSAGDDHVRRVPAAELCAEASRAAADDRHLLAADRGFLHPAVRPLRHGPPQHRVRYIN